MCSFAAAEIGLGVIVHRPDQMAPAHREALSALEATPELLAHTEAAEDGSPTSFAAFEAVLAAFSDTQAPGGALTPVAVSPTPHVRTVPWRPQTDARGETTAARQNPYDPAFRAELAAYESAFAARFHEDPRISRVYIAPPSYFGEVEYYVGADYSRPQLFCYGPRARARFAEWLAERYGGLAGASAAWGVGFSNAAEIPMPRPREEEVLHTDTAWLDLMAWRRDDLAKFAAAQARRLAAADVETGIKVSAGDYSAYLATNTAAVLARLRDLPRLALHNTNGHSLADQAYFAALARHHEVNTRIVENDGNRYGPPEIAKVGAVAALMGIDEFNYSHFGYLAYGVEPNPRPTACERTLRALRALPVRGGLRPKTPAALLHSRTTAWVRAPRYENRDAPLVYEHALVNALEPGSKPLNWGRWLGLPDITGEELIAEGDLEGRRLLIIPNTGATVLPARTFDVLVDWMQGGGHAVTFGGDGFGLRLTEEHAVERTELAGDWRAAESGWSWKDVGAGRLWRYEQPVPPNGSSGALWLKEIPADLRRIAHEAGCKLPYRMESRGGPAFPLAVAYHGRHEGVHQFVAAGYDGGAAEVRFEAAGMAGPARMVLVGLSDVTAWGEGGGRVEVENRPADPAALLADPTNQPPEGSGYLRWSELRFDAGEGLRIGLAPQDGKA